MAAGIRRRSLDTMPAKGTKLRQMIILLLRPQGATIAEIAGVTNQSINNIWGLIDKLQDFRGWDIRGFPDPSAKGRPGRNNKIYKIVGKTTDSGRYKDLVRTKNI